MVKKEKAFTLIELIAVLVIMAILALIVTPLVMSIIKKAKVSADKRSIDAYGRSIELAIAGYLLDTGKFPTEVSQLTIEYSGSQVVCETTQINTDSSVYLAGCTVSPTYTAYTVGDQVTYNNVNYYVIKDSGAKESTVTLLKAEPLSVAEVNEYGGVGTANNHVNMYVTSDTSSSYYQTAYNSNGYGGMAYYSSSSCGSSGTSGCTTNYAQSEIKYVVDTWKTAKAPAATEARLMAYDEFIDNTEVDQICTGICYDAIVPKYDWMYDNNYWYWLGTPYTDSSSYVWGVYDLGGLESASVGSGYGSLSGVVRPVITISKSLISSTGN